MPGLPAEQSRLFFNAKNFLERKKLGEFLEEISNLQVRLPVTRQMMSACGAGMVLPSHAPLSLRPHDA